MGIEAKASSSWTWSWKGPLRGSICTTICIWHLTQASWACPMLGLMNTHMKTWRKGDDHNWKSRFTKGTKKVNYMTCLGDINTSILILLCKFYSYMVMWNMQSDIVIITLMTITLKPLSIKYYETMVIRHGCCQKTRAHSFVSDVYDDRKVIGKKNEMFF